MAYFRPYDDGLRLGLPIIWVLSPFSSSAVMLIKCGVTLEPSPPPSSEPLHRPSLCCFFDILPF